ncbi:MAG: GFA family protein [Pseudomonadota bacterium]
MRFRAESEPEPEVWRCNCSICSASGYLHLFIPHDQFELLSGQDALTSYRFGSGQAEHLFCQVCGVKSFYQPRSHPGDWSVHLQCVENSHDLSPRVVDFDGRNWEQSMR